MNRITIVRLTQLGLSHGEIKNILGIKKSLISKCDYIYLFLILIFHISEVQIPYYNLN